MDSDFSQPVDYRRQILHYTLMPDHLHLVVGVILRHNGYSTHPEPASYSFYLPRPVASQLDNPAMDRLLGLIESSLGLTGGEQVTVEVEPDGEGGTIFHVISNRPDGDTEQAILNLNDEQWFVLESPHPVSEEAVELEELAVEEEIEDFPEPVELAVEEEIEELPEPVELAVEEEIEVLPPEPVEELPVEEEIAAEPSENGWHELEIDCTESPRVIEALVSEMPTMVSQATSAYNRDFAASLREDFVESLPEPEQSIVRDAQSKPAASLRGQADTKGLSAVAIGLVVITVLAVVAGILLIWQPPFLAGTPVFPPTTSKPQATITSVQLAAPAAAEPSETSVPPTDEPTSIPPTPTATTEPVRGLFNYIVTENDTIVGLADRWDLDPTSILLCNPDTLPTALAIQVGLELRIPPEDGACINADGESTLADIADKYGVKPEAIINSPHNSLGGLTPDDTPAADMLVFIPGGTGTFQERNWSSEVTINPESDIPIVNYAPDHPGSCGEIELLPRGLGTEEWASPMYFYQRITQGYHPWHMGIDLASPKGTPIFASDRGTVVFSGWNNWGYGNLVILDHGNGWATFYGHLEEIHYDCGEIVQKGDVIGQLGSTGNSTGPHLHFEIHKKGRSLDPQVHVDF